MQDLYPSNVQYHCRTCLENLEQVSMSSAHCAEKYNIHQTQNLMQWLHGCTSLITLHKRGWPEFLCQQCYDKLQGFHEFRNMCLRSERILGGVLFTKNVSTEVKRETNSISQTTGHTKKDKLEESEAVEPVVNDALENREWIQFDSYRTQKKTMPIFNVPEQITVTSVSGETVISLNEPINGLNNMQLETSAEEEINFICKQEENITCEQEVKTTKELSDIKFNMDLEHGSPLSHPISTPIESSGDFQQFQSEVKEKNTDMSTDNETSNWLDFSNDAPECKKGVKIDEHHPKLKSTKKTDCKGQHKRKVMEKPKKVEIKFRCTQCSRRCISQANLDAHIRTHQGLRPYGCTQCDRGYNKANHLRIHIRDCHPEEPEKEIVCTYEGCGKKFKRDSSYRVHYRIKHLNKKPQNRTYVCEDCGHTCRNITVLREHRYKHMSQEEYPYHCEHCGKRYVSQRTYKTHLLRHAGIKNFQCPHCDMKTTTRNEILAHINYHTKEKQWACPLCPSVFNNSANLSMHNRIVHKGIRRFSCRFCDRSFGKADTLKYHEMRHTGERPQVCEICNKGFIQAVALRNHMKTHNKFEIKL